jgi:bifunctional DNA-binding transcriptional regulator/antitoxin component of YhaV-PrlF toxin-antitoxin module
MTRKITKSTERGQITLPKEWRDAVATNHFMVEMHKDRIVIMPLNIDGSDDEEILFDAVRDNDGKAVSAEDMIRILKKIQNG